MRHAQIQRITCTGTGSYLTAVLDRIAATLTEQGGDGLVAAEVKEAALSRIHGFELLPAPFVVAHLRIGIALQKLGVQLNANAGERASVYLTNALTGWVDADPHPPLPFPEFIAERDAADAVKRETPILVVLGNPPYNGFAGVSPAEEGGLVEPYKVGLADKWDITKNKLDDLYIRFFRIAERRVAEQTGKGIICFVSNSSWLGDPSAVVMRERLLSEFDTITIDHLNGDSRETGKKTPDGKPDPSIFSTPLNPSGITRGVAISMLVRTADHGGSAKKVEYRDFWGQNKREQLAAAASNPDAGPPYESLSPAEANWFRLLRWSPRPGYASWPAIPELCAEEPMLGLNENRKFALIDGDRDALISRMKSYFDANIPLTEVDPRLATNYAGFNPASARERLLSETQFDDQHVMRFQFRPLDMRYAYVDTVPGLWNRSRPLLVAAESTASGFLLVRRRAPRALDGTTLHFSDCLIDQKVLFTDAYAVPLWLSPASRTPEDGDPALFSIEGDEPEEGWRPNLSVRALTYLQRLGIDDAQSNMESATLIWLHGLAIGVSPLYVEQNGEAVRSDWPRIPLPQSDSSLRDSSTLGRRVAHVLNLDEPLAGVDKQPIESRFQHVATIARHDGSAIDPGRGDLAVTAGWGIVQQRAVMPGPGRFDIRERLSSDKAGLLDEEIDLLGEQVLDVYLNEHVSWQGVPAAVWDFKIGGFQVLRKWLSYREKRALGRDLTLTEARTFTTISRPLTALVLLGPELDSNYLNVVDPTLPGQFSLLEPARTPNP